MTEGGGGESPPPVRQRIRAIEKHCATCEQCRLWMEAPTGKLLLCLDGDALVQELARDVYNRHMAMVRVRQQHYRQRRDPWPDGTPGLRRAW